MQKLKRSILLVESIVSEGTVGSSPAILIRSGPNAFRLLVGDELDGEQRESFPIKEIRDQLVEYERHIYSIEKWTGTGIYSIEMWTGSKELSFFPRKAFTIFGQRHYARLVLDILLNSGLPIMSDSSYSTILEKIREKVSKQGMDSLSHTEQVLHTVYMLEGIMVEGDFSLLFSTPLKAFPLDPLEAMEEIRADHTASVLRRARNLIPSSALADKRSFKKWQKALDPAVQDKLTDLEEEFVEGSALL